MAATRGGVANVKRAQFALGVTIFTWEFFQSVRVFVRRK